MEKSPQIPTQLEKNIFPVRKNFFPNWIPKSVNLFSVVKMYFWAQLFQLFKFLSPQKIMIILPICRLWRSFYN